jgi:hypothetical protein
VVEPDGWVIFSARDDVYRKGGFEEKQASLEKEGRWRRVTMSEAAGEKDTRATALGFPDVIGGLVPFVFARVAPRLQLSRENGARSTEVDYAYSLYLCGKEASRRADSNR